MIRAFIKRSKAGLIVGTIGGVVLVLLPLLVPSPGPILPENTITNVTFLVLAMCLPVILSGTISGSVIEGIFIRKYLAPGKSLANCGAGSVIGCIAGGFIFFPVGAYLGLILGGMFGGGLGSAAGEIIGLSKITIAVGIALGMLSVTTFVTLIGSAIYALIGSAIIKLLRTVINRLISLFLIVLCV